jgi:hypothetical protein
MSANSWQLFADALAKESECLGELGAAALAMTTALVSGPAAQIEASERSVELQRVRHGQAHTRRVSMMKSGFGDLTLRQVCGYAPAPLRRSVFASLRDLRTRGIALRITVANNKSLINAGLARIAKTVAVLQKAVSEQSGTYRRRGTLTAPNGSLIVSRKA